MRLLSFDTSTANLHACLVESGRVTAQLVVDSNLKDRQYAASRLIPTFDELLAEANWRKSDLNLIVVGVGPGSFTGVRAAVVTARTIAQALTLPLIGVSILECYAYADGASTAVVLAAGRDLFFQAAYDIVPLALKTDHMAPSQSAAVDLVCRRAPACVNREAIFEMLKNSQRCLVDASSLPLLSAAGAQLHPLPHLNNIAVVQSELALNRLSLSTAGTSYQSNKAFEQSLLDAFPYESIQPLYLRSASVTLKGPR